METAGDKNEWTPTVIVSYTPWKRVGLSFRAFYKKIFRMPTFNDLYYVQLGNRNLRPEYTTQYNVGAAYHKAFYSWFAGLQASVDVYYNTVKDKIIATPTSNQLVWTMVNLGYVEIRGMDVVLTPSFRFGPVDISGIRGCHQHLRRPDTLRAAAQWLGRLKCQLPDLGLPLQLRLYR